MNFSTSIFFNEVKDEVIDNGANVLTAPQTGSLLGILSLILLSLAFVAIGILTIKSIRTFNRKSTKYKCKPFIIVMSIVICLLLGASAGTYMQAYAIMSEQPLKPGTTSTQVIKGENLFDGELQVTEQIQCQVYTDKNYVDCDNKIVFTNHSENRIRIDSCTLTKNIKNINNDTDFGTWMIKNGDNVVFNGEFEDYYEITNLFIEANNSQEYEVQTTISCDEASNYINKAPLKFNYQFTPFRGAILIPYSFGHYENIDGETVDNVTGEIGSEQKIKIVKDNHKQKIVVSDNKGRTYPIDEEGYVTIILDDNLTITTERTSKALCFMAEENGSTIQYTQKGATPNIEYTIDDGATWNPLAPNTPITINEIGDYIYVRGLNENGPGINFVMTGKIAASGNTNSLLDGDDGSSIDTVPDGAFSKLFENCASLTTCPELPAKTVGVASYQYMFHKCTSIVYLPNNYLPATTLNTACYSYMFETCTMLSHLPEQLPAMNLTKNCYEGMFSGNYEGGCDSIREIPKNFLPAKVGAESCYTYMFGHIGTVPAPINQLPENLLAEELAYRCCAEMFMYSGVTCVPTNMLPCTMEFTEAELDGKLPSTEQRRVNTYYEMFAHCPLLVDVSNLILPMKRAAMYTYTWQFEDCENLKHGPLIKTTDFGISAAQGMFMSDDSLLDIPDFTVEVSYETSCQQMFNGCHSLGGVCPAIINTHYYRGDGFYSMFQSTAITSIRDMNIKGIDNNNYMNSLLLMFDACHSLVDLPAIKFEGTTEDDDIKLICTDMFEDCTAIKHVPGKLLNRNKHLPALQTMFTWCYGIETVDKDLLPITDLHNIGYVWDYGEARYGYSELFKDCYNLKQPPDLPATILTPACYTGMFSGCTLLEKAPELPATELTTNCYANMFSGCQVLRDAPDLYNKKLAAGCYGSMFNNCTSLRSVSTLQTDNLVEGCYSGMFNGCAANEWNGNLIIDLISADDEFINTYCKDMFGAGEKTRNLRCYYFANYDSKVDIAEPPNYNLKWINQYGGETSDFTIANSKPLAIKPLINGKYDSRIRIFNKDWKEIAPEQNGYFEIKEDIPNICLDVEPLYIQAEENNAQFSANITNLECSYDKETWIPYNEFTADSSGKIILQNKDDKVYFCANNIDEDGKGTGVAVGQFTMQSGKVSAGGDVLSLLNGEEYFERSCATEISANCFAMLFSHCIALTNVPELSYTLTKESAHCYDQMFLGCTGVTVAPNLPSMKLADYCYYRMLAGTNISSTPELPATVLPAFCYCNMFENCESLTKCMNELIITSINSNSCSGMFQQCTSLETAPHITCTASLSYYTSYFSNMFKGCFSLAINKNYGEQSIITTGYYTYYNYSQMFYNTKLGNVTTQDYTTYYLGDYYKVTCNSTDWLQFQDEDGKDKTDWAVSNGDAITIHVNTTFPSTVYKITDQNGKNYTPDENSNIIISSVKQNYILEVSLISFNVNINGNGGVSPKSVVDRFGWWYSDDAYIPFSAYYPHSYSESIYAPEEIGGGGTIKALQYYVESYGPSTLGSLKIYLKEVDGFFTNDFTIPVSEDDCVYNHTDITIGADYDEEEYILDTPFVYSGTNNLLVALVATDCDCDCGVYYYYSYGNDDHQTLINCSESSPYDLSESIEGYSYTYYKPDLGLVKEGYVDSYSYTVKFGSELASFEPFEKDGSTLMGYYTTDGVKVLNADGTFVGPVKGITDGTSWTLEYNLDLYAQWGAVLQFMDSKKAAQVKIGSSYG